VARLCDELICLANDGGTPPANNKPGKTAGDPVDLFTGRLHVTKTDVTLPARIPIHIQRSYWSGLTRAGLFGLGWNLETYDVKLVGRGTALSLVQGDQAQLVFVPDGTGRWINLAAPYMAGGVITQLPGEFNFLLRLKDGTTQRFDRIIGFSNVAGLTAITDRNGNSVTITRVNSNPSSFGQITRIAESAGRAITLAYDGAGRIQAITDPLARTVHYTYDPQGRLETVTDQAGGVTRYAYDGAHRITSITDPRNITFLVNEYDGAGRVFRQTLADGGVWQFDYATQGSAVLQTTVTDPRGHATTHRFNSQGFALSTTDALGQTTTFEYGPNSNLLVATTDPLGRVTRFTYDAQGNLTSLTDPAGTVRGVTYEPIFNQVSAVTNPLTPPTQFGYDAQGNLTTITDPLGKVTTLTYNAFGQLLTSRDPLGQTTTFTYDATGNLASVADPLGNTTRFDYDAAGRRLRTLDPLGRATAFAYDPLNRVTTIVDALGGLTRFAYDPNGNLLSITDARGHITAYTYDGMDRLATRTDPLGAAETFVYDPAGNLTQHTDRKGQVSTFAHDALNRQVLATYADSVVAYTYDSAGRLVRVDDSAGGTLGRAYDALDRLIAESTPLGRVAYQYDVLGRRTQVDAPGVAPTTYAYDAASRLRQIVQGPQQVALDYDDAGRRTLLTLPHGVSTEYQYDLASRLTAMTYRHTAGLLGSLTYGYDAAGNRVEVGGSFARTGLPAAVASASYDAANRQRAFGSTAMTFDANGNLVWLTDPTGTTAFTWDARDRLLGIEAPGTLASFGYLGGHRTSKVINGAATQFLYDGLDVSQQIETGRTRTYLRTPSIDETVGTSTPDGSFAFIHDALGNTLAIVDGAGAPLATYTYEPFGATAVGGEDGGNPFQFTGRENDQVAGLYYYRARYYHPTLQRFISEDPLGFAGGDANLYAYVFNSPTKFSDPLGLDGAKDECSYAGIGCDDGPPPLGGRKDPGPGLVIVSSLPVGGLLIPATGLQLAADLDIDVGLLDICRKIAKRGGRVGSALLLACELALGARRPPPPPPPPPPRREVPTDRPKGPNRPSK
jgi:RHS repeat-associated protein